MGHFAEGHMISHSTDTWGEGPNFFKSRKMDSRSTAVLRLNYYQSGSSAVERRTRNRESTCSNTPFGTVSKIGHFHSLHDAPVHSAV